MAGGKKKTPTVAVDDGDADVVLVDAPSSSSSTSDANYSTHHLVDIAPVYLLDRNGWNEFKRALNECGLIWNIPHWMTTIVYKGKEWEEQAAKGINLAAYFVDDKKTQVEGKELGTSELGAKLIASLGLPKNMGEYIQPGLRFCVLNTVEFESDRKLPARQKLWNWLLKCLRGPKLTVGPYYYLIDEVKPYDISHLFKRLCQVLEQITICSLDDELELIIKMDYKPQTQNIFSYLANLRKAIKRLHDLNERLPKEGQIWIPDSFIRSRLVRAARQVSVYKPVLDALLIQPVEKWSVLTVDDLYHQLESVCANDISFVPDSHRQFPTTDEAVVSANFSNTNKVAKKKTCHEFSRNGTCGKTNCQYAHSNSPQPTQKYGARPPPPLILLLLLHKKTNNQDLLVGVINVALGNILQEIVNSQADVDGVGKRDIKRMCVDLRNLADQKS